MWLVRADKKQDPASVLCSVEERQYMWMAEISPDVPGLKKEGRRSHLREPLHHSNFAMELCFKAIGEETATYLLLELEVGPGARFMRGQCR